MVQQSVLRTQQEHCNKTKNTTVLASPTRLAFLLWSNKDWIPQATMGFDVLVCDRVDDAGASIARIGFDVDCLHNEMQREREREREREMS
jgi:hypothetical protein